MAAWFLDFEGFHFPGRGFIIKEIAILNKTDKDQCYTYFITGPKTIHMCNGATFNFQYKRHHLLWEFGDYEFVEAMMDVARWLKDSTVYMKGREKFDFIRGMFPLVKFIELDGIPAFKYLNNCMNQRCSVKHGNCCARRKVHELMHYVSNSDSF